MTTRFSGVLPGSRLFVRHDRRAFRSDLLGGLTLWAMLVPRTLDSAVPARRVDDRTTGSPGA